MTLIEAKNILGCDPNNINDINAKYREFQAKWKSKSISRFNPGREQRLSEGKVAYKVLIESLKYGQVKEKKEPIEEIVQTKPRDINLNIEKEQSKSYFNIKLLKKIAGVILLFLVIFFLKDYCSNNISESRKQEQAKKEFQILKLITSGKPENWKDSIKFILDKKNIPCFWNGAYQENINSYLKDFQPVPFINAVKLEFENNEIIEMNLISKFGAPQPIDSIKLNTICPHQDLEEELIQSIDELGYLINYIKGNNPLYKKNEAIQDALKLFESENSIIEIRNNFIENKLDSISIKEYLENLRDDNKRGKITIEWTEPVIINNYKRDSVSGQWLAEVEIYQLYTRRICGGSVEGNPVYVYKDLTKETATIHLEMGAGTVNRKTIKNSHCIIKIRRIRASKAENIEKNN